MKSLGLLWLFGMQGSGVEVIRTFGVFSDVRTFGALWCFRILGLLVL